MAHLTDDLLLVLVARRSDTPTVRSALDQLRIAVRLGHADDHIEALRGAYAAEREEVDAISEPERPLLGADSWRGIERTHRTMASDLLAASQAYGFEALDEAALTHRLLAHSLIGLLIREREIRMHKRGED